MCKTFLTGFAAAAATALVLAGGAAPASTGMPGAGGLPAGWTHAQINVVVNGQPHTLQYDRGLVEAASATSLTLREADSSVVTVAVGPSTAFVINGQPGAVTSIRPGATAVTMQIDGNPAQRVQANVPARLLQPLGAARARARTG